jgi:hypothetical protein
MPLLVAGFLGAAIVPATASANHIPGVYTGTHSAPAPGMTGTVELTVSTSGQLVTEFTLNNVAGTFCIWEFVKFYDLLIDVDRHTFAASEIYTRSRSSSDAVGRYGQLSQTSAGP